MTKQNQPGALERITLQATATGDSACCGDYISLARAAQLVPGRPSANCVWRWCRRGITARDGQRVRLEHIRLGGRVYTRAEWITAFGKQLAEADAAHFDGRADGAKQPDGRRKRTKGVRDAQLVELESELQGEGI